ncbi:MAG: DUF1549 domain-containing protein, partial [Planctomycetaceae bacterium]|nr:DUF1549 domain-containing protein [Planctomycetaceae bacterium]
MVAVEALAIVPGQIALTGPEARQQIVVERMVDGKAAGDVTAAATFQVANPEVAAVDGSYLLPRGDGSTTITATVGELTASAAVTVAAYGRPFEWSFRNHVEAVLTKGGCNSGACHGAAAGKKGFKLSLRGYDPEGDYLTLTRQSQGRRIIPSDPGRSLILTKPSGAIPHGGGVRLDPAGREYRVLADWIAAGMPGPRDDDPRLDHLEILPALAVLKPGATQQLIVLGHFTDGRVEDVTRWVKYTATSDTVAAVDDAGLVQINGPGEGAITVWYLSRVVTASILVPYEAEIPRERFAQAPRHNFIDELVLEKLAQLNVPPSEPASDAEFLRRAHLDTIGVLPTVAETKQFLADTAPDKRERLIDALLARPEFVDYWTYKWSDLLLVNSEALTAPQMWSYYNWIRNNVAANTPWDALVRQLVTATGNTLENGAANFFVLHQDPLDLSETTSVAFLGMSINCARCHNHPMEKWTNSQYYAMANLYARVRTKNGPSGSRVIFSATEGDVLQPLTGKPQPPCPLDGEPLEIDDPRDRRGALAAWLTSPENPYFSRAITNRVWANFFGAGLVENIDDLRLTNPPSNAALLDAAAGHLARSGYDLKSLMKVILQSATYQASSRSLPENAADRRSYSRYYPRRLMAEVLLDAFAQVTGAPSKFPGYPEHWRALQLPDSNVASYFLKTFGRPDRVITCECERGAEPSMVQVLHISNGDAINSKLEAPGNRIEQLL